MKTPHHIIKVWVDDTHIYAEMNDSRRASYAFSEWPRLRKATNAQRQDFYLSHCGIHWPQIDEDLSFDGMFNEKGLVYVSEKMV